MLTTGEFQRRRGPLIRWWWEGKAGVRARFKTHACCLLAKQRLLPARLRVFGLRALRLSSLTLPKTTKTTTTTTTTDVGSLCRGPRLFVYVSRRLMALVLRASFSLLLSFPPSSFLLSSPLPSCRPISSLLCHSFPFLFLLFEPASRNRSHSNILHLWNILKSPFHQAQRSAINRLFPLLLRDPMPKAFISGNI